MASEGEVVDCFSHLPDDPLLTVLAHVSFKDLCRLGCVCHRLRNLTRSNILWKRLCYAHWVVVTPIENSISNNRSSTPVEHVWYSTFIDCYLKWGQYLGCYSTVKGLWNRIETALNERGAVDIVKSLNGPLTQENILTSLGDNVIIPADLMCSLHIHDGQHAQCDGGTIGLGGLLNVYSFRSCPALTSYANMVHDRQFSTEAVEGRRRKDLKTLQVLSCPISETTVRICLNSTGGFKRGNMFYCHRDFEYQFSFSRPQEEGFFRCAESFTHWLRQLADKLADPGTILLPSALSRFYHQPSCVAVTEHVKVSVATAFVAEMSHQNPLGPGRKVFAYYITMEMDDSAPMRKTCQLRTRHWTITDGNGGVETVDGAGVVGDFPIMKPGAVHSWSSYTSFVTSSGTMGGHFGMVNLQTGEMFNVKCPDFHMKALPFLELSDVPDHMEDDT